MILHPADHRIVVTENPGDPERPRPCRLPVVAVRALREERDRLLRSTSDHREDAGGRRYTTRTSEMQAATSVFSSVRPSSDCRGKTRYEFV